jgi:hypothetical protein
LIIIVILPTMSRGSIDTDVELFFTDSGPVTGSTNYTTLVIYHGAAFNGCTDFSSFSLLYVFTTRSLDSFSKLIPFAAADNIRLVSVNRRHYTGSTKYTDDEFHDLQGGQKSFMERTGRQVANFLLWFAKTNKIPQISLDCKSGGFAVMGWSLGNATTLSVLGHPESIPKDSYRKLEPYFRQLIMYGGLIFHSQI